MQLLSFFFIGIFVASCLLTYAVRRYALDKSLLDIPNERSSHVMPTPRGGGLAIAGTFLMGIIILAWQQIIPLDFALALATGGLLIALIGFLDDCYTLPGQWRLLIHFIAAGLALYLLGGLHEITIGLWQLQLGELGNFLALLMIVWFINLYNFMDGIDGLASIEGIFVGLVAAIALLLHNYLGIAAACLVTVAAIAGFLVWNWPPAKIFMGDVSSGLLGFIFALFIVYSVKHQLLPLCFWLILLAVFIVDATCTLLRRIYLREQWYAAHRSHAYQRLVQRGLSHQQVILSITAVNLLLLLPGAWLTLYYPAASLWLCLGIMLALSLIWWKITKAKF